MGKSTASVTIRIIDARQSRGPRAWRRYMNAAATAGILFGPGVLIDSAAMQWAGFVILMVLLGLVFAGHYESSLTLEEARKKLDDLERAP